MEGQYQCLSLLWKLKFSWNVIVCGLVAFHVVTYIYSWLLNCNYQNLSNFHPLEIQTIHNIQFWSNSSPSLAGARITRNFLPLGHRVVTWNVFKSLEFPSMNDYDDHEHCMRPMLVLLCEQCTGGMAVGWISMDIHLHVFCVNCLSFQGHLFNQYI